MKRTKILTIFSIILIVFNILLISFIFLNRPGARHRKPGPEQRDVFDKRLIRKLELTDNQKKKFRKISKQHRFGHQALGRQIFETRGRLYESLGDDSSEKEILLLKLDSLNSEREKQVWRYTEQVYTMLNNDQKRQYKEMVSSIPERFRKGPRRKHGN